jgi:hypothetical protein
MRQPRICGRCGKPVKRGQGYIEAVGIRIHLTCLHEAEEEKRKAEGRAQGGKP